jgi:hypothetical protein
MFIGIEIPKNRAMKKIFLPQSQIFLLLHHMRSLQSYQLMKKFNGRKLWKVNIHHHLEYH